MLKMKKQCETCNAEMPADSEAFICSFECTFCPACTRDTHQQVCPNCQGELIRRPRRLRSVASVAQVQVRKKV